MSVILRLKVPLSFMEKNMGALHKQPQAFCLRRRMTKLLLILDFPGWQEQMLILHSKEEVLQVAVEVSNRQIILLNRLHYRLVENSLIYIRRTSPPRLKNSILGYQVLFNPQTLRLGWETTTPFQMLRLILTKTGLRHWKSELLLNMVLNGPHGCRDGLVHRGRGRQGDGDGGLGGRLTSFSVGRRCQDMRRQRDRQRRLGQWRSISSSQGARQQ
ncbi:hypothetical protein Taro_013016 [Colocasia esculenta]|uniref:Uncharacterized protein n=1 Tax=Colocasia esculenta TaxID=4460 RepID=A0A843UF86_COLES|nr:hypothetical protein [Colocasia esculenta]